VAKIKFATRGYWWQKLFATEQDKLNFTIAIGGETCSPPKALLAKL